MKSLILLTFFISSSAFIYCQTTKYANPFIGTSNGGNTFPGAVVPWGMVSLSPHNCNDCPSGYNYGEKFFYGMGHTHLSGTGCAELGNIIVTVTSGQIKTDPEDYKQPYSNEKSEPGYYSVHLDSARVTLEATTTIHCGIIKIIADRDRTVNILIDAGRNLSITGGGEMNIISANAQTGYNISGGFCGEENREEVYFYSEFSIGSKKNGTWIGENVSAVKRDSIVDSSIGSWSTFTFITGDSLLIKTGISYVSEANARLNLETEIPGWGFNQVRTNARGMWEQTLSRVNVEDSNDSSKVKFYTALYHSLIHPNIISDVNGDYPLMGRSGIGNYKDRNRYSVFSLWDTYRTLHSFLTLVYPERESEMVRTMLDMAGENRYLPKWELAGNETYMMAGDPADVVISDTYIKGIRDFNGDSALAMMMKPAVIAADEKAPPVRAGYHELLKYGYIPFEQDWNSDWWVWGPVSTTLEYCYSDWAIAQLAKVLKRDEDCTIFLNRSTYYKNLFDSTTLFFRPRSLTGQFVFPFDSLATEGAGDWTGAGGPGYVEGNAWDYAFYIPFDAKGMINLFGGEAKFYERLHKYFNEGHFNLNNEPVMTYPYLFTQLPGRQSEAQILTTEILDNDFNTGPDGLPGNDDCGAISSWYLFSSMGYYPLCPGLPEYSLTIPQFNKIEISLNKKYYRGDRIIIEKHANRTVIGAILINDEPVRDFNIKHSKLVSGIRIIFN